MTVRNYAAPVIALLAVTVAACASTDEPAGPPNLAPVAGQAAPPRAKLYTDCVAQAVAAGAYDRTSNSDTHLIRFTCSGEPARAFFTALEGWSAARDSQWSADGRVWRSTNKVRRDLFGVDYCSSDGSDHRCTILLNAGEFLVGKP